MTTTFGKFTGSRVPIGIQDQGAWRFKKVEGRKTCECYICWDIGTKFSDVPTHDNKKYLFVWMTVAEVLTYKFASAWHQQVAEFALFVFPRLHYEWTTKKISGALPGADGKRDDIGWAFE